MTTDTHLHGSIPGKRTELFPSPQHPDRLLSPPNILLHGNTASFAEGQVAGTRSYTIIASRDANKSKSRMSEMIPESYYTSRP